MKTDEDRAANHPKGSADQFACMTVSGVFYSEKFDAGQAILDSCKKITSPKSVSLGEYRGFSMELYFDVISRDYRISLKSALSAVLMFTETSSV